MLSALLPLLLVSSATAGESEIRSCSPESLGDNVDPCLVSSPAGLLVFRQRFEPDVGGDMGSWGIDGLEVLDCKTQERSTQTYSPTLDHEQIGSYCHRSPLLSGDNGISRAEEEWAQSEVGEGVEEVWERAWDSAGRYISTLSPTCAMIEEQVPEFFQALHRLHSRFPVATILADSDIIPADDVTYALPELMEALAFDGHKPLVTCDNTTLFSISWPLYITGTFQSNSGSIHPAELDRQSNCPVDGIIYPPTTSLPPTTTSYTWDAIYRPTPRPITMSHDEERLVYSPEKEVGQLKFFKGSDEGREERGEKKGEKQYWRDEL